MKFISVGVLAVFALIAVSVGSSGVSIFSSDETARAILINIRIPRAVFAISAGAILGLSGSVFQLVLKNPLADSFTTGTASCSALGAVAGIALGLPLFLIPPVAAVCGILGLFAVYSLSMSRGTVNPVTMILAGIVVNIIASSGIGFIKFMFEDSLSSIVFWLMGGFFSADYVKISVLSSVFAIGFIYFLSQGRMLNLLALDEFTAMSSGINVKKIRRTAFIISTIMVAVTVSYTGLIGFVGLIVPHIARSMFGSSMSDNIFYSSVFGAVMLLVGDILSRVIIPGGSELPVGIITAVLGGGFFLYLLKTKRERLWSD